MTWKERLLRSLPYVFVILSAAGVVITEELWLSLVALMGMWLLPSPLPDTTNVSRETSPSELAEYIRRVETDVTAPCVVMHGSAEPHVEGCEGWTLGR